jgi:hypothetical protein
MRNSNCVSEEALRMNAMTAALTLSVPFMPFRVLCLCGSSN